MVNPPVAVASVSLTALCRVSVGLFSESINVSIRLPSALSNMVNEIVAESVPEKALAPLLSGTKIARPAVTVALLGMPGAAITLVWAPTLTESAEYWPEALHDDVEGQLSRISARGCPKFVLA